MDLAYTISHFFYPRFSNNHKAKLLHTSSLFLLSLFLILYQLILQTFPLTGLKILGYAANIQPSQAILLANEKRQEAGFSALNYSPVLEQAARSKGEHMLNYDYWSHVAPDGTDPWVFFIQAGYKYRYAGENLARDFSNPQSTIDAWMASPSHRENILSAKYQEIGVAVVEGDLSGIETTIIVQLFGTKLKEAGSGVPIVQAKPQTSYSPTPTIKEALATPTPILPLALISPLPSTYEKLIKPPPVKEAQGFKDLISPFDTTRKVSLVTIISLLIIMTVDGAVVSRKKIPRIGGRTFAHMAFLGMILALVLVAKAGEIL